MLSIKQRNKISKTINRITKGSKKRILFAAILLICVVTFALITIVLFYSKDIITYSLAKTNSQNPISILKKADEAFKKGYLENSALEYQNYLNTNPDKAQKMLSYRKIFAIHILQNNFEEALITLKLMEVTNPSDNLIYIDRIKLLLRMGNLTGADFEIRSHYKELKKSPEFIELCGIRHMLNEDYEQALSLFTQIKYRKRGYDINKKIVCCYLKLNQLSRAISYINKMETIVRTFDDKEKKGELNLLKNIVLLFKGEFINTNDDFRPAFLAGKNRQIALKLMLLNAIMNDELERVNSLTETQGMQEITHDFFVPLANYYAHKKQYDKALHYYEKIGQLRTYTQKEMRNLADLYYAVDNYSACESTLINLNQLYEYKKPAYFLNQSYLRAINNDYSRAYSYLKQGILDYPEDSTFWLRLGILALQQKDIITAEHALAQGREISHLLKDANTVHFDLLKLAINKKDKSISEIELLEMRNAPDAAIESYFRLIEFYLSHNRLFDGQREINAVSLLPLQKEQKIILTSYKLIYALLNSSETDYKEIRPLIAEYKTELPFFEAICLYLDNEVEEALQQLLLAERNSELFKTPLDKILYLQIILYSSQGKFARANQSYIQLKELIPHHRKANYLMSLLKN